MQSLVEAEIWGGDTVFSDIWYDEGEEGVSSSFAKSGYTVAYKPEQFKIDFLVRTA